MPINFRALGQLSSSASLAEEFAPTDATIFVSSSILANDYNDGLSWGSAKRTIPAALSALPLVSGKPFGTVLIEPGTYTLSSTLTIGRLANIVGAGSDLVTINYTGNSDAIRWTETGAGFSVLEAGTLAGFTLDGSNAGSSAVGVHLGDIVAPSFDGVVIQNFTGASAVGLWLDNITHWTERTTALRLRLDNNTINQKFTVNGGNQSFGYNRWLDIRFNVNSGQIGIQANNSSYIYSNTFIGTMNVGGGSGNTAIGIDLLDTSFLYQTSFSPFAMEQTSGTGATSVSVAAGASFGYNGLLICGGMPFAGTASRFFYQDNDTAGVVSIAIPGDTGLLIDGTLGRIFQMGPMAGNITSTTFSNLLNGVVYTLIFLQDNTGSRSISLPASVKWAGGSFPTWSTTGNYRDIVQFYFDGVSLFEISRSIGVH